MTANGDIECALKTYADLPAALRFPSYHPQYIVADARHTADARAEFFIHRDEKRIYYHGFLCTPVQGTSFIDIQSPYGYGGPISNSENALFLQTAWKKYCQWCAEKNVLAEFMRFHPLLANEQQYQGTCCYDRKTIWLDLTNDDLLGSYSVRVRTAIRKALKSGLAVHWCERREFIAHFPELYRATMRELAAAEFYLFDDQYFADMANLPNVQLALCKLDGEVVGGAVFLLDECEMEYHLSAANGLGKKMSATNLLLHEAAAAGRRLGCKALHLGGGTDGSEDNLLLFFKAGFSKKQSAFHIGYHIHQPEPYRQLREQWRQEHGEMNSRVLFYR